MKKYRINIAVAACTSVLSALLIYPHSKIAALAWLVGAALAPGSENHDTGMFVFMVIFTISTGLGMATWGFVELLKRKLK